MCWQKWGEAEAILSEYVHDLETALRFGIPDRNQQGLLSNELAAAFPLAALLQLGFPTRHGQ